MTTTLSVEEFGGGAPRKKAPAAVGPVREVSPEAFGGQAVEAPAQAISMGGGDELMASVASMIDFPLSLPGFFMSVGAGIGSSTVGAVAKPWTGQTWKEVYADGLRQGGKVAEMFTNPMQKVLAHFGKEKEYENAPITQALHFVTKKIEEGGAATELMTKGQIPSEAFQLFAQTAMISGIPGLARVGKAVRDKITTPDVRAREAAAAKRLEQGYGESLTEDLLGKIKQESQAAREAVQAAPVAKEIAPLEFEAVPIEPSIAPKVQGASPRDILQRIEDMRADQIAVERGEMPLERAQARQDARNRIREQSEMPAGLDYSQFQAELSSRRLVEQIGAREEAVREGAWNRYQEAELSRQAFEVEQAYRQRAEQRGEAPEPGMPEQAGGQRGRKMWGPGARQGGAIDPSVFADMARIAYKSGKDLQARAREIFDKYGEDAARVFIDTYQREELKARGAPEPMIAKVLGKAAETEALQRLDYLGGAVSTRVRNISAPLHHRLIEFERRLLGEPHTILAATDDFFVQLDKAAPEFGAALSRAILTNDGPTIQRLLHDSQNPKLIAGWKEVRKHIDQLGDKAEAYGIIKKRLPDYFPRIVIDREGLLNQLGVEAQGKLLGALKEANKRALQEGRGGITPIEESAIINSYVKGFQPHHFKPGFSKDRTIREITEALQPYYASPVETFHTYIRGMVHEIEKAKLFGKDLKKLEKEGYSAIDMDESIGNLVARELKEGRITEKQVDELTSILRSRFGPGERASWGIVQDIKNLGNAGLLGNPVAAVTQFGDLAAVTFTQGVKPTLEAVAKQLTGQKRLHAKDFGLVDHISEEFVSTRGSAKFVNAAFKYGLFSKVDLFGKSVALNAAKTRFETLAQTPKGVEKIAKKYREAYGEDFGQLVQDLKAKKRTDLTDSLVFHELSDLQPISKMEMPQAYLDLPNGRTAYWLKTFMLKQVDLVRREAYNKIKAGKVKEGLADLTRYGLLMGTAGATTDWVKDWMLGKTTDFEAMDIPANMLKTFGWSEYALEKVKQGKPLEATAGIIAPPYKMYDKILSLDPKAVQYMPVGGKLYYYHFMGGAEEADKRERKQKRKGMSEMQRSLIP